MLAYCFGKYTDSTESLNADIEGDPLYQNTQLGRIQEGLLFFIRGQITHLGERFIIDFGLENSSKDLALRIAARVSTNSLGRNSRIKRIWGTEETTTVIPISLNSGESIEIQVLLTVDIIYIAFNGLHIAKYGHRLRFHDINSIEIRGDIEKIHVERRVVTDYPIRPVDSINVSRLCGCYDLTGNIEDLKSAIVSKTVSDDVDRFLPLPCYSTFYKGFLDEGFGIAVKGVVRFQASMFKIALQVGQNVWPQPTIALLLEFRFAKQRETGEPLTVRNSFANGKWTGEVKHEFPTGLRPGAKFHLVVVRGKESFEIYMNKKPITDYPFKVNPRYVDTCVVSGDITLFNVVAEID